MLGWLIYSKVDATENKTYIEWFIKEALLQNMSLKLILREDLTIAIINNEQVILLQGKEVALPSFAVVRTVEPFLNQYLEAIGILTFNSATISNLCNHKSITYYEINKLNIPMVDTVFLKKENISDSLPMPFPFIVKEATGRSGKQVSLINNNKDWNQCIENINTSDLVIQSSNVKLGKDIRVFIIGKEIIGAVIRESTTDFRANFKLGGSATWYPLDKHELTIINKIVQSFDFDMVGIDFLVDLNGNLLFNEIEDVVGSRILSAVSDINILKKYIKHIKSKCK